MGFNVTKGFRKRCDGILEGVAQEVDDYLYPCRGMYGVNEMLPIGVMYK